jgi:hypothetical protein
MTTKDYIIIANVIRGLPDRFTKRKLVHELSMAMLRDNPRFSNTAFVEVCGLGKKE